MNTAAYRARFSLLQSGCQHAGHMFQIKAVTFCLFRCRSISFFAGCLIRHVCFFQKLLLFLYLFEQFLLFFTRFPKLKQCLFFFLHVLPCFQPFFQCCNLLLCLPEHLLFFLLLFGDFLLFLVPCLPILFCSFYLFLQILFLFFCLFQFPGDPVAFCCCLYHFCRYSNLLQLCQQGFSLLPLMFNICKQALHFFIGILEFLLIFRPFLLLYQTVLFFFPSLFFQFHGLVQKLYLQLQLGLFFLASFFCFLFLKLCLFKLFLSFLPLAIKTFFLLLLLNSLCTGFSGLQKPWNQPIGNLCLTDVLTEKFHLLFSICQHLGLLQKFLIFFLILCHSLCFF